MTLVQGLVLGILQGLSEFLPISSSGHLLVFRDRMGLGDIPVLFDIILHVATLLVVLFVFRRSVSRLAVVLVRWPFRRDAGESERRDRRLILQLLAATAVTAVLGLTLQTVLPEPTARTVFILFLVTAALLLGTLRARPLRDMDALRWTDALVAGAAQGFGVLPGISRSGATISASLYAGMSRPAAGEFSFLLSIPAILGALVLEVGDAGALFTDARPAVVAVSFLAAFVSGLGALRLLLWLVRSGRLAWFCLYLIPAGILGLILG